MQLKPLWLKFQFNFNFKTLGCRPNRPQGWSIATTLENPGLFKTCAMHPGYVSGISAIAAKTRRCAVSSGVIFERGQRFLGHNFTHSEHFKKTKYVVQTFFLFF